MEIIMEKNPKLGQRLAAKVLSGKSPSPGGRVHLDLGAGRSKMKVAVNAPKGIFQKKQVSAQELHEFCLDFQLGIGAEQKMGAKMNDWFGSGSMETGYREGDYGRFSSQKCGFKTIGLHKSIQFLDKFYSGYYTFFLGLIKIL